MDVDLDAHLEEEQRHSDVCEQLDLVAIGHISRREW